MTSVDALHLLRLILDTPWMRELSVAEQRYRAVLEVIAEGRTVGEVAAQWGVTRQSVHGWLARYEAEGLEGLADRSHRPVSCPHQMSGVVEALVLELRRAHPYWGARRIVIELARKKGRSAAFGARGLPGAGPGRGDRPGSPAPPQAGLEALGARRADGVVADGRGRRVRAG